MLDTVEDLLSDLLVHGAVGEIVFAAEELGCLRETPAPAVFVDEPPQQDDAGLQQELVSVDTGLGPVGCSDGSRGDRTTPDGNDERAQRG